VAERGWSKFSLGLRRITIDANCVNSKGRMRAVNQLERWQTDGLIKIQKSSAFGIEIAGSAKREEKAHGISSHPPLATFGVSSFGDGSVLAGPNLAGEIRRILFPTVKLLSKNQSMDVQHLAEHVRTGGHLFVTTDMNFTVTENDTKLRALGIWAVSPEEAVRLIAAVHFPAN
jgi:hypothetical protein